MKQTQECLNKKVIKINKYIFYLAIILFIIATKINAFENKILVKVNNEIITTIDILNEIKFLTIINREFNNLEKNKKIEIAKNSLIREKVKLIELKKFTQKIELNDEIYENIIKNYFSNLQINDQEGIKSFFEKQNLDNKFIKEKISIDTLWNRLIYEKFYKNVKINKKQIKKNIKKNEETKEFLLSEIVFNINDNENYEEKINLILKTIKNKKFSDAAFNFSISDTSKKGGKIGWIKEDVLSNKIKNELINIEKGEITKPIVLPGSFIILKVEDIKMVKKNLDLKKELEEIILKKTNEQLNQYSIFYLNKLKKNVQINEG